MFMLQQPNMFTYIQNYIGIKGLLSNPKDNKNSPGESVCEVAYEIEEPVVNNLE